MKNSGRQKCGLKRWRESRSRNTLISLSLSPNLVILYQCLPLVDLYQKRGSLGDAFSRAENRCRENKGSW